LSYSVRTASSRESKRKSDASVESKQLNAALHERKKPRYVLHNELRRSKDAMTKRGS
jgi:hypothetical protein